MSDSCYPLIPVESSTVEAIGHNDLNRMIIRFKTGAEYAYDDVPADVFQALKYAESKGAFFAKHIKSNTRKYPCERLSGPIAAQAVATVNEYTILQDRVTALEGQIVRLSASVGLHIGDGHSGAS